MIKVLTANSDYRRDIISLWKQCFGDSEDYISFFLDNCPDYVCVAYFANNKLVSMLFLLNGTIKNKKCKYLYAACTDLSYRNQGIMEKLILFSKSYCIENKYSGIFLVPANEKLYSYYSKFGFISSFLKKKLTFQSYKFNNDKVKYYSDVDEICRIKVKLLNKIEGFKFDEKELEYTIREHLFNGGCVSLYDSEEGSALAFYYCNGNDIIVKELLSDFDILSTATEKLFLNNNTENIYILTPIVYNEKDIEAEYTKCGMCLPLDNELSDYLAINKSLYAGMYLD